MQKQAKTRFFGLYKPFLGGGRKILAGKSAAFTLIEILLVVSIIGILAGAGLPSLGKALRVYRFKANANQVQAFLYLARNSAMSEVRAEENPDEIDTNFDGTIDDSDLLPFAYVFEITHGANNAPVILRTYADFNTDESVYFSDTDVFIKQKTFLPNELQITYEGLYDFESPATSLDSTPNGKTYSFSYDTVTKQFSMIEYVASTMSMQDIDLITIEMTNPDATRTNTINLFHLSGAPFVSG